jgi:hypothetical protein
MDMELFARIRRMRDRFDALTQRITEAYAEVPVAEGLAEIDLESRWHRQARSRSRYERTRCGSGKHAQSCLRRRNFRMCLPLRLRFV